ncbi:Fe-S cluster assembly sulfur transfer protein SufU [Pedosphaera parvula]|uniref:SUF system FeS assembly protein, NifU family n=1 Tax=Pedosphaera parvula (strain Ellin514) TaxID=320771 RepID=B9XEV5_PEDPL|nr:SUF system NifU family Fe-S cluster assembly protein [Pedosphaera parvula]EEF61819.1 SUF system FeS assembly protein, NifU family [Pedosphaera parvula Ellin514]
MSEDLDDLYQQVILDHCKSPRNFHTLEGANRKGEGYNPLCGDNYTVFLKMNGDTVEDAAFQGSGCCISKASASLLTSIIKGKSKAEVKELFKKVHTMVTTGEVDDEGVGKLAVFAGVHKFPARVKCAILSWHAAVAAVEGQDGPVTTENENT